MSFTFTNTIPAQNNSPSLDQPLMLQNNVSNQAIWAVDHLSFNQTIGGQHQWTQFPQVGPSFPAPTAPTGRGSVAFPGAGIASNTIAQYYFQNSQTTYPISLIKAWGYASGSVASPTNCIINNQSSNITSVVRTSTGQFTVVMPANTVGSDQYGVIVSLAAPVDNNYPTKVGYGIISATSFGIFFANSSNFQNVTSFTFMVLQI